MGLPPKFMGYVFLAGMFLWAAKATVYYSDFVLKETNFTRLCSTRSIMTVNDSFPGPVIRVRKGDTLYVNVYNQGDYGVTLHWHGVKQPRNPWSDGPEYITQCAIQPGTNFTYEVIFSTEEGTLWWHAHSDWTRATVHGAIVILPVAGTVYPFPKPDEEEILILASWYNKDLRKMVEEALKTGADTPRSDAYTINGQPGDLCPCSNETTYRLLVDHGKTYLLRIINANTNAELFFSIAQHNLTLVAMDGAYTKPVATSYIMISPGQTMDVLVRANQSFGNYYMAARQYSSPAEEITNFDHSNATAILEYRSGNSTPIFPSSPSSPPIFPSTLPGYKDYEAATGFANCIRSLASPEHPTIVPRNVSRRMYVAVSMGMILCPNRSCEGLHGNRLASSLNNSSWVDPTTDILWAYYRNMSGIYETDFPNEPPNRYNFTGDDLPFNTSIPRKGTKLKVLNYNEAVEIVFQGTNVLNTSEGHPMHLHGHSFYVVGMGFGNFNQDTDPNLYNFVDPPLLNTVGIPKRGWAAIRFITNNPGVWYLHCHFDRHLTWGMDTVLIVKNGGNATTSIRKPPPYLPSCGVPLLNVSNEELNKASTI